MLPHRALPFQCLTLPSCLLPCFARFKVKAYLKTPGLDQPVAPSGTFTGWREDTFESHAEQISPDSFQYPLEGYKNVNFHYTTATFTISPEPWASLRGANLPGDLALYAVSVRRLIALHSGFLQTLPLGNALAIG